MISSVIHAVALPDYPRTSIIQNSGPFVESHQTLQRAYFAGSVMPHLGAFHLVG